MKKCNLTDELNNHKTKITKKRKTRTITDMNNRRKSYENVSDQTYAQASSVQNNNKRKKMQIKVKKNNIKPNFKINTETKIRTLSK